MQETDRPMKRSAFVLHKKKTCKNLKSRRKYSPTGNELNVILFASISPDILTSAKKSGLQQQMVCFVQTDQTPAEPRIVAKFETIREISGNIYWRSQKEDDFVGLNYPPLKRMQHQHELNSHDLKKMQAGYLKIYYGRYCTHTKYR